MITPTKRQDENQPIAINIVINKADAFLVTQARPRTANNPLEEVGEGGGRLVVQPRFSLMLLDLPQGIRILYAARLVRLTFYRFYLHGFLR